MKYFDVEFGLCKQREPAVHLEEDNASRWHPMHPLKDSFLRVEGNCLTCMRSIGTGRNTWELSGNDVLFKSPSDDRAVCRFREAQTARKWFELEVKYAKNGTVDGWDAYNVRGDWCTTNMIWRRVVDGKFQRAAAIEGAPNLAPANRDWSTVEMPKRCLMGDLTRNNFFACTVNPGGSQASEWRYKIQGRMITSETYRRQGDQRPSMVREEVYPGEEEAQVMFSVMRAALGKVANNNNKGKWFNW
ncbi:hypothetical protein BS17DRAFT_784715 [Gyrodon lividus]|nr:hypothetical protein BS17DRAFT_784715 [Gyrodon lividus]